MADKLLRQLKIGDVVLGNNVILAPIAVPSQRAFADIRMPGAMIHAIKLPSSDTKS